MPACTFRSLSNGFCIDMHTRTPTGAFLRCSDDTLLCRAGRPIVGAFGAARRGGDEGSLEQMPSCPRDKEPLRHPLFSFPLRSFQLSSAAHQSSALHMKRAPVFMPRKLAYRAPPRLISQKTPSHLCHVSEARPSSARSPFFFPALSSPLSPLAVPFSPLNYGC